jgi:hypothetical protein
MSLKYTKAVLQDLYDEQVAVNRALEKRLLDLEARLSGGRSNPVQQSPDVVTPATSLMVETAKIIQDSSFVEKNSPFLKDVDEASWATFSLLYAHYRQRGGLKPTRDLMSPEVLNYYAFQIAGDLLLLDDTELFNKINVLNQPSIDPMNLLISGLSMKFSKNYEKHLVQQYISSFITLLANYPIIKVQCKPEAIVKQFYKKLQPKSLSQDMLNLEIKDVTEAIQTLHAKLKTKDIQYFENTRDLKKHVATDSSELQRKNSAEKCANCKFSTKPENFQLHRIWNCRDIDFCHRCNQRHMALGSNCKFKDKKIFDFEAYLEKKKGSSISADQRKYSKVANIVTDEYIKKSDFDELKSMFVEQITKIDKKLDKTSNSDVSKELSGSAIIIDSGCNHSCINDASHSVSAIKPNRRRTKDTIWVADGRTADIEGTGNILNHKCSLVPSFSASLLSVFQTIKSNNAISIFTDKECFIIKLDKDILNIFKKLTASAKSKNLVLVNGQQINGIYTCQSSDFNKDIYSKCITTSLNNEDTSVTFPPYINLAGASYYTNVPSVSVDSIKELVRFFHETWNHASIELMCSIVKHKLILNIPTALTETVIRKHFPNCGACPIGNLQQRPALSYPTEREIQIAEEWEIDLLGPMTDENKKKCPSFSGALYGLICKDIKSRKRIGFLLRNKGYLLRYLKHLINICHQHKRKVNVFRMDSELVTAEITAYCESQQIQIHPCVPHEHATLGNIERDNRTVRESIMKSMANKPHITRRYWGMCLHDVLFKMDLMPHPNDATTNAYNMWYGRSYDMIKQPILDFGCIVMAHIPLKDQGMLTGRAIETYYVGPHNNGRHGGVLLYNPHTRHTIVRRTFRVMGPVTQSPPQLTYEAAYEDVNGIAQFNQTSPMDDVIKITVSENVADLPGGDTLRDNPLVQKEESNPVNEIVHQYGNDNCIENDPVPVGSSRKLKKHRAIPPLVQEPEHFVVEKIINHKGTAARPGSMHLFVKWLGYDDTENSWIKWEDNQDLAAIDTYLANNPDIEVPVFEKRIPKTIKEKKKKKHANVCDDKTVLENEKYYCNFLPAKCISSLASAVADHAPFLSLGAFRQVPHGTPRKYLDIENLPDREHWFEATKTELENMYRNTVWDSDGVDETTIPKHLILPSQLIFEKQFNPDGSLKKYKCRLVIRGDKWFDIYHMDTYASTVKSETVKICMAIAATEDMEMELIDVRSAFLYSLLKDDEVIYMRRPPGLNDSHMPKLVRLRKCIYGMKQASAYFHAHSDAVLRSFGCVPTAEDDCCYILNHMGCTAIINKHVDDFGIMSKSKQVLAYIRSKLAEVYDITVDSEMKYYLGHHIIRDRQNRKIYLDQSAMISDMATKFNLPLIGPFPSTPMEYLPQEKTPTVTLNATEITDYQSRVGSVLYIAMHSRPDILFATSICTTKTSNPTLKF